jgi:hypothetical protein
MRRLTKPGYRFLAEMIMMPSTILLMAAILGVLAD